MASEWSFSVESENIVAENILNFLKFSNTGLC